MMGCPGLALLPSRVAPVLQYFWAQHTSQIQMSIASSLFNKFTQYSTITIRIFFFFTASIQAKERQIALDKKSGQKGKNFELPPLKNLIGNKSSF